jgi:Mrp family chromosome partitioning ATPase
MVHDPEASEPNATPAGGVQIAGPTRALAPATPREWLLPGGDEFFRSIYTRLGLGASDTLAVSSAIAGEGKTTIALGLGVTIAQDYPERRVLVVETDYQRPVLAKDFDLAPNPGLVDCLLADESIWVASRPTVLDNLYLVPAGGPAASAGRWLRSSRMARAVDAMRQGADIIILDLPAILLNSDALPLIDLADGVVFVVRGGVTPSSLVHKAIAQFNDSRGGLRGVVLNGTQSAMPGWLRRLCGL